jgi:preprotein translocase subunit SecD
MNDFDVIEQRLRRTFEVVADQPVAPTRAGEEPWRRGPPVRPRSRILVGAAAAVVVIAALSLGVAYGPRSSTNGANPAPPPSPSHVMHAVFAPSSPRSAALLEEAAAVLGTRLHALGDGDADVVVKNGTVDVSGPALDSREIETVAKTGEFSVRPVLCGAPAYVPPSGAPVTGIPMTACQGQYALSAANLDVNTSTGQPANVIPPDPSLAAYPSTSPESDYPAGSVLLPDDPSAGSQEYPRYVLGAAQFAPPGIAGASAEEVAGQWTVVLRLTSAGASLWNTVAQLNFHQYVAFDVDGQVLSAPLIEPSGTSFSSFATQIQISGNFSSSEAQGLAAVLGSGPLPVSLKLLSLTSSLQTAGKA